MLKLLRSRWLCALFVLGVAAAFAHVLPSIRFTTSILHFLPQADEGAAPAGRSAAVASALTEGDATQTLIVDLGSTEDVLAELAPRFLHYLEVHPGVLRVRSGGSAEDQRAIAAFLTEAPPWTFLHPEAFREPEARRRLERLKDRLSEPASAVYAGSAPRDPFGGVWDVADVLASLSSGAARPRDGILYDADRRHAFFFVTTKASAFDAAEQRMFLGSLREWIGREPARPSLELAGAAPYAIASEAEIKHDIQSIGVWSTLGIILLFAVLFRSLKMIVLAALPIGIGSIGGLLTCHYAFGAVHGITVAFGTSLLGVGIDYAEHYYTHYALAPNDDPFRAMQRVWSGIAMGGLTTILGLAGLFFSGSRGLREIAVFSAASVAAAFLATVWLVPPFMPRGIERPAVLDRWSVMARRIVGRVNRLGRSRGMRGAIVGVLAVAVVLGGTRVRMSDEVGLLVAPEGAHVTEDRQVRQRLESAPSTAVAVLVAKDDELGERLATLEQDLTLGVRDGLLGDFPRFAALLPGVAQQRAAHAAAVLARGATRALMTALDFDPDAFGPYWSALEVEPAPLTARAFMASPLNDVLRLRETEGRFVLTLPLRGITDVDALQGRVRSAFVVSPREEIASVFRGARRHVTLATCGGVVAIFLVLAIRYGSLRLALTASLPALVAIASTVAIASARGVPLTILHLVALLLVLGMGVDYGVFLVDKVETVTDAARSLVSIVVASLTTILSFGLLGLSRNPGLSALGSTVALGVTLSLVFCPLAIAAFRVQLKDDAEVEA